ncbi:MAG: hypothetical protein ACI92Z_000339 [Paracoccaceae bacterium]|jgi:hypothetical protein
MSQGGIIAMAHWRRLDRVGTDRCTLSRGDHGSIMTGQAIWQDNDATSLDYVVCCDEEWRTLSADIVGTCADQPVALRLARGPQGWTLNETLQPGTAHFTDIDLSFTPATNFLPLRRLTFGKAMPIQVHSAWLVPDLCQIQRLDQTYTRLAAGAFTYASANFTAELETHPSGFVTRYPGLWEGWVDV